MREPRLFFSDLAVADILAQADWYELQSNQNLAKRWERAVTSTVSRLVRMPRSGAPCEFKAEALRGTRRLPVDNFPAHMIFYQVSVNQIHILRVLHGARDMERLLSE